MQRSQSLSEYKNKFFMNLFFLISLFFKIQPLFRNSLRMTMWKLFNELLGSQYKFSITQIKPYSSYKQ